ncbi:MAG: leucine-rich repeat domain-containing protein [Clostridia bacterium]|nr:leucine-rich repeat domain-containing protein [Clostridia bacterium]
MKKYRIFVVVSVILILAALLCLSACDGGENTGKASPSEGLQFTANADNTYSVSGRGACTDKYIVIPETTPKGHAVTGIAIEAFKGDSELEGISIPQHIKSIGARAFYGCYNMTDVAIDYGVTTIGEEAFLLCKSLQQITLPESVTHIDDKAFAYCDKLVYVTAPNSLQYLGDKVFEFCYSLEYTQHEGVCYLGNSTNPNLILAKVTDVSVSSCVISPSTKFIDYHAFKDCTRLMEITLPEGLKSIGYEAFWNCRCIGYVTIPSSVVRIESSAFAGTDLADAWFVSPDGWTVTVDDASGIRNVDVGDLTDSQNAAFSLKNAPGVWTKN